MPVAVVFQELKPLLKSPFVSGEADAVEIAITEDSRNTETNSVSRVGCFNNFISSLLLICLYATATVIYVAIKQMSNWGN